MRTIMTRPKLDPGADRDELRLDEACPWSGKPVGWAVGPARAAPHLRPARQAWAGHLLAWFVACAERRRQRRILAELEDWLLDDIGRTRAEAQAEADRPFWG